MKKIYVMIFICILLVGTISALDFSWDNYKEFEATGKYGKISIFDRGQIGEDSKLADYELLENTDQCLIDCYAQGTAIMYYSGKLFNSLDFKNTIGNSIDIKESTIYISEHETYEVEVPDYKEVCKDISNKTFTGEKWFKSAVEPEK